MSLLVGALLEDKPGQKYKAALRYAELALRPPLPKAATLKRWREALPEGFQLALRAPESAWRTATGAMGSDQSNEESRSWLQSAAEALDVQLMVLATGAVLSPGQRDRDRLRAYVQAFKDATNRAVVWLPGGLWEAPEVQAVARSVGAIGAFNPLEDPAPDSEPVYASLHATGWRRRFSESDLLATADTMRGQRNGYVTISSLRSFQEACQLQAQSDADGA